MEETRLTTTNSEEADETDKTITDDTNQTTLDETWYYYQNPTTGSVSTAPLTLRQLCRLFCPVREGLKPILPSHTRCLMVQKEQFGEWKLASELDVLKEASAQWFLTSSSGSSTSEGPFSCRKILEDKPRLVYSTDITPQWVSVDDVTNLKLVMQALDNPATTTANETATNPSAKRNPEQVKDELEAFLSSTAEDVRDNKSADGNENETDEFMYESDGGTKYVKDALSGNWVHEALAPQQTTTTATTKVTPALATTIKNKPANKKQKKGKFSKRNAKNWIYATGLPINTGITVEDIHKFFAKVGLLDLDPETLKPKIKLYHTPAGDLKGDTSLCYARPESVSLALQILDESPWDEKHIIRVQKATFEAKEGANSSNGGIKRRRPVSEARRKVARLALLQAQDEGFGGRLSGGRKGLRIIVVKHMMEGIPENELEDEIHSLCQEHGEVEKITCMEKTKTVIIKFAEPTAASNATEAWHGKLNQRTNQKMEAIYWDGVTDYTQKEDDSDEEERHDEFGKWLEEQQELPPELQLQVAKD
jgi:HIV Tat-specific factor 1